jgi:hypothetical protein
MFLSLMKPKTKICTLCQEEKETSHFGNNIRTPDGFHWSCKVCTNTANKEAKYRHRYGITLVQKSQMIVDQNGKCAICDRELDGFNNSCVDHNHKTGEVRSILCQNCNLGLGSFYDKPNLLLKARDYLVSWNVS